MASIPLRLYNREIEGMIDSGQNDEAIAHCRHILQSYPKYIQTYRLLGKTYLESQRYSDASDIFQRLLSVAPDDFVAHVGMSIIREDENNLDTAIWHMERAFETQPSNTAIQEELRRLYGRRDGIEPPKIRLTRGALARMYARGNLYEQAIAELRAAISEDTQRIDLQVLLAQMLFHAGMLVEAINVCKKVINKYPYCFEANRLLAILLSDTIHTEEAEAYRKRLIAMDPYYIYAAPKDLSTENVPDNAVTIERLEYRAGQTPSGVSEQPAWASSLGVAFENEGTEQLPEWLREDESKKLTPEQEEVQAGISAMSSDAQIVSTELTDNEETEQPAPDQEIPDWMKEAGWQPATGLATESSIPLPQEETEGEIVKGEIPDWLKDMAPEGALDIELPPLGEEDTENILPWLEEEPSLSNEITEEIGEKEQEIPSESVLSDDQIYQPDRLHEIQLPPISEPVIEQPQPSTDEQAQVWLADLEKTGEAPGVISEQVLSADLYPEPTEETKTTPETPTAKQDDTSDQDAALAWLESLAVQHGAKEEELITPPGERSENFPEWLHTQAPPANGEPTIPTEKEPPTFIPSEAPEEVELPDWLLESEPSEAVGSIPSIEVVTPIESIQETELPDWLMDIEPGEQENQPPDLEAQILPKSEEEAGFTEWLHELETFEETTPASEVVSPPPQAGETLLEERELEIPSAEEDISIPSELDQSKPDAALAWLEGLAVQHGAKEDELITKPEDRAVAAPEWVQEQTGPEITPKEAAFEPVSEIPEEVKPVEEVSSRLKEETIGDATPEPIREAPPIEEPVEEIPSWLEDIATDEAVPEEASEIPAEGEPVEETPSWWQEETIEEAAPAPVVEAPSTVEPVEEIPSWLEEITTEEVAPEMFSETPAESESVEEAPSWLQEEAIEEPAPETVKETPSLVEPAEEIQSWIEDVTTKKAPPEATSETPPDTQQVEELPPWLQDMAGNEAKPEQSVEATIEPARTEEIPAWLQEEETTTPTITESATNLTDDLEAVITEARRDMDNGQSAAATTKYSNLVNKGLHLDTIIQELQDALYRFPVDINIWQTLGDAYMRKNDLQKALEAYTKAEELLR